jgi:hypothetical protein
MNQIMNLSEVNSALKQLTLCVTRGPFPKERRYTSLRID